MEWMPAPEIGTWNGWIFMSVFLLQMVVMMIAGRRVWEKSHVPAGARHGRLERHAGVAGNVVWFSALAYSVFLPFVMGTAWFYAGLFFFFAGLICLVMATASFMTTPAESPIHAGVYRFSRHPMYLASFLICLGTGFATASWLFVLISVLMALCFHQEALIEERWCLEKYGGAYREYMNSVPRWLGF